MEFSSAKVMVLVCIVMPAIANSHQEPAHHFNACHVMMVNTSSRKRQVFVWIVSIATAALPMLACQIVVIVELCIGGLKAMVNLLKTVAAIASRMMEALAIVLIHGHLWNGVRPHASKKKSLFLINRLIQTLDAFRRAMVKPSTAMRTIASSLLELAQFSQGKQDKTVSTSLWKLHPVSVWIASIATVAPPMLVCPTVVIVGLSIGGLSPMVNLPRMVGAIVCKVMEALLIAQMVMKG